MHFFQTICRKLVMHWTITKYIYIYYRQIYKTRCGRRRCGKVWTSDRANGRALLAPAHSSHPTNGRRPRVHNTQRLLAIDITLCLCTYMYSLNVYVCIYRCVVSGTSRRFCEENVIKLGTVAPPSPYI